VGGRGRATAVTRSIYFITHPNVVVDREVPVPRWPLSDTGIARMRAGFGQPWVPLITSIYCSMEQKAIDAAALLANHLGLHYTEVEALGENDRSSTGFLPPDEFERAADRFFAHPERSMNGWERAVDAQARICAAAEELVANDCTSGAIALVAHGAVGTLLYCKLAGHTISRAWDQPPNGGGNYFRYEVPGGHVHGPWAPIDV
jgi:broad specificity phosphatase PhoE